MHQRLFIIVVIEILTEDVRMLRKESPQIVSRGETDSEVIDAVCYSFSLTLIAGWHINRMAKFIVSYPPTHSVHVCAATAAGPLTKLVVRAIDGQSESG